MNEIFWLLMLIVFVFVFPFICNLLLLYYDFVDRLFDRYKYLKMKKRFDKNDK